MTAHNDRERVPAETAAQWRVWLSETRAAPAGFWLVSWKTHTKRPRMTYEESVEAERIAAGQRPR